MRGWEEHVFGVRGVLAIIRYNQCTKNVDLRKEDWICLICHAVKGVLINILFVCLIK